MPEGNHALHANFWCFILLLIISPAFGAAADAPPSKASILQLFEVTGFDSLTRNMEPTIEQMVQSVTESAVPAAKRGNFSERQRSELAALTADLKTIGRQAFADLETRLIALFSESYTQSEIDMLLTVYRSEVGRELTRRQLEQQSEAQITEYVQSLNPSDREAIEAMTRDLNGPDFTQKVSNLNARAEQTLEQFTESLRAKMAAAVNQRARALSRK